MTKYLIMILLFLFPTSWCRLLLIRSKKYRIMKGAKIGFSILLIDRLYLSNKSIIGHCNLINIPKFYSDGSIRCLNYFNGYFAMFLGRGARINHSCKFSSTGAKENMSILKLGDYCHITVGHLFDMTDSIFIGNNSVLGGAGTQVWTHGFFVSRVSDRVLRHDGKVVIRNNVYVGSRCCINCGITIDDGISIGSQTCVSKSLAVQGLYVSQPIRYVEYDPDEKIRKYSI